MRARSLAGAPAAFRPGPRNEECLSDDDSSPRSVTMGPTQSRPPRLLLPPVSLAARSGASESSLKKRAVRTFRSSDDMVTREGLSLNSGKLARFCTGLPGKYYHKHDCITPITDGMMLMYHRLGWGPPPFVVAEEEHLSLLTRCSLSTDDLLYASGYGPAPPATPTILCKGCKTTCRNDFTATDDKSHLVCRCGVVCSAITIATDREKNCSKDEDKTTHADKPYESRTDKFDHPAQSCDELRKQREREATGTRISKKTKEAMGLGWQHEHSSREAAKAERQRASMSAKDQTKGVHIQQELDKLFTPLEPLDHRLKRFVRMEADRCWREAVRHAALCHAGGRCQQRIGEKGPAIIAESVLACSLSTLIDGTTVQLEAVSRSTLLVVGNKLGAQQAHKGTSCAMRAVRTIVGTILSHSSADPIPPCPPPAKAGEGVMLLPASSSSAHLPFARVDSSMSDIAESTSVNVTLQLRDSIVSVFHALDTAYPNSVREGALAAIQDSEFRDALGVAKNEDDDVKKLVDPNALGYVMLAAVADQLNIKQSSRRGCPASVIASFGLSISCLAAATTTVRALLPEALAGSSGDADGLFD